VAGKRHYFQKFGFTGDQRLDAGARNSLPDGYKLRWTGRLKINGKDMFWDGIHVGCLLKVGGNRWVAIPLADVEAFMARLVCPTCQEPTLHPITTHLGLRCKNPDNVLSGQKMINYAIATGVWSHGVVWLSSDTPTHPSRDHAILSLIPKGE
jgi:hypothetical protein